MTPITRRIDASRALQRPVSAMRAKIGPMIQIVNAANDPKKAIVELNPGSRIDTQTDATGSKARSSMKTVRLTMLLDDLDDGRSSFEGIDFWGARIGIMFVLRSKNVSMIRLTWKLITERRRRCGLGLARVHTGLVDNANFVLVIDELHKLRSCYKERELTKD
jgi:hypothetical protein